MEDSLLFDIVKEKTIGTNSMHHQSVKTLAEGWKVCAKAPDGTIEAIELPEYSFAMGFQWHPEHLFDTDEKARLLFKKFVDSCAK
jgi:putative glutamine amidotransferase